MIIVTVRGKDINQKVQLNQYDKLTAKAAKTAASFVGVPQSGVLVFSSEEVDGVLVVDGAFNVTAEDNELKARKA